MGLIYPSRLPQSALDDKFRSSEIKIYNLLKNNLPDEFVIFYSVAFHLKRTRSFTLDGEADFIIVHPHYGVIVLEVKGGRIEYDGRGQKWTSTDRYGVVHSIKNPVEQAKRNHYSIRQKLAEAPNTKLNDYTTCYAVCFPDVSVPQADINIDLPRKILIDCEELSNISKKIGQIHSFWHPNSRKRLSPKSIEAIINLFSKSWSFTSPLKLSVERDVTQQDELTEQQFLLLDFLQRFPEALICGCAGSGKTFLAAEKAKRLAQEGFKVAFICWNTKLANWISEKMTIFDNVYTSTATRFVKTEISDLFDALIVDEGQDIPENYWPNITARARDEGLLYIFYDDNQKIYHKEQFFYFPIDNTPYTLNVNCRNTEQVHRLTLNFYVSQHLPTALVNSGKSPEFINCKQDILGTTVDVLDRLITREKIAPDQIVILTPRGIPKYKQVRGKKPVTKSVWKDSGTTIKNYVIARNKHQVDERKNKVVVECSTIQTYKGLEKEVVILTEIDSLIHQANVDALLYVALSRCRSHLLVLFESETSLSKFKSMLQKQK